MSPITHRIWQQVVTVISFELISKDYLHKSWGMVVPSSQCKQKGRHKHLNMLSQASRILSNRILGDDGTTRESSSQAPAACSASVCEIKLVRRAGVNLFCLDQMVMALLKYRLRKKTLYKELLLRLLLSHKKLPETLNLSQPQIITFSCLKIIFCFFCYSFFSYSFRHPYIYIYIQYIYLKFL